ncbi:hypothetical protein P7C70_g2371, partial [Phenoliferia sp. Uapishka_3]
MVSVRVGEKFYENPIFLGLRYLSLIHCDFTNSPIRPFMMPNLKTLEVFSDLGWKASELATLSQLLALPSLTLFKVLATPVKRMEEEESTLLRTSLPSNLRRSLCLMMDLYDQTMYQRLLDAIQPNELTINYPAHLNKRHGWEPFLTAPRSVERLIIDNCDPLGPPILPASPFPILFPMFLRLISSDKIPGLKVLAFRACERSEMSEQLQMIAECGRRGIQLYCKDGLL